MNRIRLEKNGVLIHNEQPLESDPLTCLGYRVDLEAECTLRNFFQMLERYAAFARLNPFIPVFIEQFHSCPDAGCTYSGIDHIELRRTIEMIGFPGDPSLEIYVSLDGHSGDEIVDIKPLWLESLLDMDLRLGKVKHVVFGDHADTFTYDTVFSLFELLDGICWQLSFHNMPSECRISF